MKDREGCGDPECGISSGYAEEVTFGQGEPENEFFNGYWEKPCLICAQGWKKKYPEDSVWPEK
jgi:hypothetical protein